MDSTAAVFQSVNLTYCSEDGGGEENRLEVVPVNIEVLLHYINPSCHGIAQCHLILTQKFVNSTLLEKQN